MPILARRLVAVTAFALTSGAVMAQEAGPFINLEACRLDDENIRLLATFEGSPCDATGQPGTYARRGTVIGVHIPVERQGEQCLTQIVPVSAYEVVPATRLVMELDVAAVLPSGIALAEGTAEIVEDDPTCSRPSVQ